MNAVVSLDYMRGVLQIDPARNRSSGKGISEEYMDDEDEEVFK